MDFLQKVHFTLTCSKTQKNHSIFVSINFKKNSVGEKSRDFLLIFFSVNINKNLSKTRIYLFMIIFHNNLFYNKHKI